MTRRRKSAESVAEETAVFTEPKPKAEEAAVFTEPKPKAKAVTAVYAPVGNVRVNLTTPSGNDYQIAPCQPFKIAGEDVDWFFNDWHWAFRQRLCRAEDYHPTCGYSDPKAGKDNHKPRMEYSPKPTGENKPPTSAAMVTEGSEETAPVTAMAESETKE